MNWTTFSLLSTDGRVRQRDYRTDGTATRPDLRTRRADIEGGMGAYCKEAMTGIPY